MHSHISSLSELSTTRRILRMTIRLTWVKNNFGYILGGLSLFIPKQIAEIVNYMCIISNPMKKNHYKETSWEQCLNVKTSERTMRRNQVKGFWLVCAFSLFDELLEGGI